MEDVLKYRRDSLQIIYNRTFFSSKMIMSTVYVKWNISCHINKQGCLTAVSTPNGVGRGGENVKTCIMPASHNWDVYERNGFSAPKFLHLPIHKEKVLNFLIWDILFSLISNNLLRFILPTLFCKTSVWPDSPYPSPTTHSLTPPHRSLEQSCQSYLRGCLWGLKS